MQGDKGIEKGLSDKDAPLKCVVPKTIISTWVENKEKYLQVLEARGTGNPRSHGKVTLINQIMSFSVGSFVKGTKIFQLMEC